VKEGYGSRKGFEIAGSFLWRLVKKDFEINQPELQWQFSWGGVAQGERGRPFFCPENNLSVF